MRKSDVFVSEYYNANDVKSRRPILLTISDVRMEEVGTGANASEKCVAYFKETDSKKLVVTSTKYDAISLIAKSDETKDWEGVQIVLEAGHALFAGKTVDAISIRPPRRSSPPPATEPAPVTPAAPAAATTATEMDDEIPF